MNRKLLNFTFYPLIFCVDILLIYCSFVLAYKIRFYSSIFLKLFPATKGIPEWPPYFNLTLLIVCVYIIIFSSYKLYQIRLIYAIDEFFLIIKGVIIGTIFTMAITFIYREYEYSRLVVFIGALLSTVSVFIWHELIKSFYKWITATGIGKHNILIVGQESEIKNFKNVIKKHRNIVPLYVVEKKEEEFLLELIKKRNISEIYITASYFSPERMLIFSYKCEQLGVDFKIIPTVLQILQGKVIIDDTFSVPVFNVKPLSLHGLNFYYKRIFDVIMAITILSFIFIPLIVVAFLIKIDSEGPVFYMHKRMGHRNRSFYCYKFRTMCKDSDIILEKIKHLTDRDGPVFKMKNDPRITRVGRFLRRYSIDEFPQLINVLRGEMSIVGPRPQVLWEAANYNELEKRRLRVLPGLTGLWQVSGRANLSYQEMIELDLYYIENWTFGLDMKILFKTLFVIFSKQGAY